MSQDYCFSSDLSKNEIELKIASWKIEDIEILKDTYDFSPVSNEIIKMIKSEYHIDSIKRNPLIALFRRFYWQKLHLDPTKIRPASEALLRRILHDNKIPKISPIVDAYNWASIGTLIPMSAYDLDSIHLPIHFRLSSAGEEFQPIGRDVLHLDEGILVVSDSRNQILSQYPYRDSKYSMLRDKTRSAVIIACGIKEISDKKLLDALAMTKKHCEWLVEKGILRYTDKSMSIYPIL